jgi:hypothetical protein
MSTIKLDVLFHVLDECGCTINPDGDGYQTICPRIDPGQEMEPHALYIREDLGKVMLRCENEHMEDDIFVALGFNPEELAGEGGGS